MQEDVTLQEGMPLPESPPLRSLRDRPFELLAELERRGRALTGGAATDAAQAGEWVGVALKMAGELYLVAREEAREVLGVPAPLTRVPGARSWILGLANVHGQLLPIIDLRAYLETGATPNTRNARVIVVNHREIPAGLLVDEVLGFRRFADAEFTAEVPPTIVNCARYIAGSFRRGGEHWPVLSLRALVEDSAFLEASA
ncbi:MAG TPA: chemotaxis protein CheW [Steroidobacteraceae bacterium]|nr:chemotaxis protein CheW [Steroidobacteraceae bacterium]